MATDGGSPFDQLGNHYDQIDLTCPECGYEDVDGSWRKNAEGNRVVYSHVCPSCGNIRKRTLDLDA